ncbi:MAG: aminoglycoside 3'-phosphotransferase [Gemmatimonadota bacterium]|nr:MAG: aminoglycoside 3'-phosphotransferase [Gemmatimonadota bacterium]
MTYRLHRGPDRTHFLKLARAGGYPSLDGESLRMEWAADHLPVPRVLECGSNGDTTWLLTEGLGGLDATHGIWSTAPERLVRVLATGLRAFHDAPVSECPFDFGLDVAIAHARRRVAEGLVEPARDFHEEFGHLSAQAAMALLERTCPESEFPVVCHGDYCPPNLLIEDWATVGYVDLGELGVADRWWDLSVATWSVTWNFGPGYEDLFLAEYGVERDRKRTDFYRLLYDLVS